MKIYRAILESGFVADFIADDWTDSEDWMYFWNDQELAFMAERNKVVCVYEMGEGSDKK